MPSLGHEAVFRVSTIPSVGFRDLEAIPVLKDFDVMSRIAVPVVSEPVPAVVGTYRGNKSDSVAPTTRCSNTCNKWSKLLSDWKTLANRRIDKVHKVRILVNGEPGSRHHNQRKESI